MDAPSADLGALLDRLKQAQHALIDDAARQPGLPSTAIIRKIAVEGSPTCRAASSIKACCAPLRRSSNDRRSVEVSSI